MCPIGEFVGSLGATRYLGSAPPSFAASRVTSGTIARARMPALRFGTVGSTRNLNTAIAPPSRPRWVSVSARLNSSAVSISSVSLTQNGGTVSYAKEPINGDLMMYQVAGWVYPSLGSYRTHNDEGAQPDLIKWIEFQEQ